MVEVFKTDVMKQSQARLLVDLICLAFTGYRATFDLEEPGICHGSIIGLLESFGYEATVMEELPFENTFTNTISNPIHSITI